MGRLLVRPWRVWREPSGPVHSLAGSAQWLGRWIVCIAVLAAALGGCMPRGTGEMFMSDRDIEVKGDGIFRSFGAVPGTQAYVDCRLRLHSDRSLQDTARRYF
jgi:hypothetical protein